jgi:putative CocE/NonD family hydrolase
VLKLGLEVPVRDGAVLRGLHYSPSRRACTVLCVTPYGADRHHLDGRFFAARGFHFVVLDSRGRGDSDGRFDPFVHDGADGHDAVQWIAEQSWCDGAVVTYGGSYCGFAQWAIAATMPAALRAIAPVAAVYPGVDFPMERNVPTHYGVQWLTLNTGRRMNTGVWADTDLWADAARELIRSGRPFRDLDLMIVGRRLTAFQEWLDHPALDDYWDAFTPSAMQYRDITIPVLTVTGQYDDDQLGALTYYAEHLAACPDAESRHDLVVGPWDHAGTRSGAPSFGGLTFAASSEVDIRALHADWYDAVLGRGPRPAFLPKSCVYFHVGEDAWRSAATLPATQQELRWYPTADGTLSRTPPGVLSSIALTIDPRAGHEPDRDQPPAEREFVACPDTFVTTETMLAFVGESMLDSIDITGRPRAHLTLSTELPDFDLLAEIYLLPGEESARHLASTVLRARYRDGLRQESPWPTSTAAGIELTTFPFISIRIQAGDRLALVLKPPHRGYQTNMQTGGHTADETSHDANAGTVKLALGSRGQSYVAVPIAPRPAAAGFVEHPESGS